MSKLSESEIEALSLELNKAPGVLTEEELKWAHKTITERAVLAERERCAQIADRMANVASGFPQVKEMVIAANAIAAAIREGK